MGAVPTGISVVAEDPQVCSTVSTRLAGRGLDGRTTSDSPRAKPLPAGTQLGPEIAAVATEWCSTPPHKSIAPGEPAEGETGVSVTG